jgi:hypothetical protein
MAEPKIPPENFVCTARHPWTKGANHPGQRVEHPDAAHVDERDYGGGEYCVRYRCPHCGHEFEVELAQ